jgi:predicted dehydrogenase
MKAKPPPVKVAVVGGGLISQAMHLPHLSLLRDRFEIVALADPSASVRERVADRFNIPVRCSTYVEAIERADPDAILVASPNGTHAETVLAALDAGLHVFVEKPLCITLQDADAIIDARRVSNRVLQVGYNNRFDRAYEHLLRSLPTSTGALRYISVLVHDPEFVPYFGTDDLVRSSDISPEIRDRTLADEARQVRQAVGAGDEETVRGFSGGFLGSLVHQVNLVHGMLKEMGEPLPATVIGGDSWAGGQALSASVRLANGARWDNAWIQLLEVYEYEETIRLFFEDMVSTLMIPSPWLRQAPTVHTLSQAVAGARHVDHFESYEEAYQRELVHFHQCVTAGEACRTPPEQARLDIEVLTSMYLQARAVAPRKTTK